MGPFRVSSTLRFFKSGKGNRLSNPMRRWFYHYLALGTVSSLGGYLAVCYTLAGREAARDPEAGNHLCSSDMVDFLSYMPFNLFSNVAGKLAENLSIPPWVHDRASQAVISWYKVDMSESAQGSDFETFQEFYTRNWTETSRPVDKKASVVAPCDGIVLAVHHDICDTALVQVKGLSYGIRALLQESPPPLDTAHHRRVAVVLKMRNKDFHHVIAPLPFRCERSIYVPGSLLPTTAAGYHWIPSVLTINERLVLRGTSADEHKLALYMALVGSTLTGRIRLYLDQRIRTNYLEPPAYAVHTAYKSLPLLARGEKVATFEWGSSVVLLMDVPKSCAVVKRAGEEVKAGEALFQF